MINQVNFEGNSKVKDTDLVKEVELRERMMFTRAKVLSDVNRIIAVYRRAGYYSVKVSPKIIRLPQNRVDLVFEINEGDETKVKQHRVRRQRGLRRRRSQGRHRHPAIFVVALLQPQRQLRSPTASNTTRNCCAAIT